MLFPNPHLIGDYNDLYGYYAYSIQFRVLFLILISICSLIVFTRHVNTKKTRLTANLKFHDTALKRVAVIFIIIVIIGYFIAKNLFNFNQIYAGDQAFHYYESYMIKNYFLPDNHTIFGYSNDYYAGYFGFVFFSPGMGMFQAFSWMIGIPPEYFIRIVFLVCLASIFVLPLKLAKLFDIEPEYRILIVLLIINASSWTELLRSGLVHDLIAILISVVASLFLDLFLRKIQNQQKVKYLYPFGILIFQILSILHFVFLIFPILVILSHLVIQIQIYLKIKKQNNREELASFRKIFFQQIKDLVGVFGILVILNLFWFVNIFKNIDYIIWNTEFDAYTQNNYFYGKIFVSLHLQNFYPFLVILYIIGLIGILRRKNQPTLKIFSISATLLYCLILFMYFFYPKPIISLGRAVMTLDFINPIIIIYGLRDLIRKIKFSREKIYYQLRLWIIIYICLLGIFGLVYRGFSQVNLVAGESEDAQEVFAWINEKTTNESRILIEDTYFTDEQVWGKGRIIALASIWTDRDYIGGFYNNYHLIHSNFACYYTGIVFDTPILDFSIAQFEEYLKMFNIEIIVCWHSDSISFYEQYPDYFVQKEVFGKIHIFQYQLANPSFCLTENFTKVENTINSIEDGNLSFILSNVSKSQKIIMSFSDSDKIKLLINGTSTEKIIENYLVTFFSPTSGDLRVDLMYENYPGESSLFFGYILSYPILLGIIFWQRYVKWRKCDGKS